MANGLLVGKDELVAAWAFSKFGLHPTPINRGLGILNPEGKLLGAILLQSFNGTNIELSYYGPRTVSAGIVRSIAKIIISEFNAARVTVVTSGKNRRLMRSLLKFKFRLEGSQRRYYGHKDCKRNTGVRFVLFREDIENIAKLKTFQPEINKG